MVRPVRVSHDSDPTFAFRIDGHSGGELAWSVGYASDLGCYTPELIDLFAGVDVLALEYNHDVKLERNSPRPKFLVDRVLGDCGHLSNDQAAELTAAIAARSGAGFPSHLVQLHLSRDCNRPELASATGRAALARLNPKTEVITAAQDRAAVHEASEALRFAAGNFYVNDKPTGAVVGQQPFGGSKASGTNDKAGSILNLMRWISPRTIKETFVPPRDWRYPFLA